MSSKYKALQWKNMSLRTTILIAICLQNTFYTLLRKYSTKYEQVSSTEILFIAEVIKIVVATWFTLTSTEPSDAEGIGIYKLIWLIKQSFKMFLLAAIYGAMNILSFVALEYIGAGEFTICAQLKILTTAGFAVLILGTSLSNTKWRALALLVLGCTLVASPSFPAESSSEASAFQLLGYGAVLTEVSLSGFASIYFEKVVKSTTEIVTIWERNFQLGLYSLLMYGGILIYESSKTTARVPWSNWSSITFSVAFLGALGGLLVAATLKYADSILKTMATAGAIVLSTLLGHYFLNGPLNLVVSIGACVTIISICNYTFDSTPTSTTSSNGKQEPNNTESLAVKIQK